MSSHEVGLAAANSGCRKYHGRAYHERVGDMMNLLIHVTAEYVAAAQVRIEVDIKLGRDTPDVMREIAALTPSVVSQ